MPLRAILHFALFLALASLSAQAAKPRPCIPIEDAPQNLNKDICITAHVYDVVELPDGTRFLDVCTPQTPDDACRFTIVSLWEDHTEVGDLKNYRDMNIQVRGIVQSLHGRADWSSATPASSTEARPNSAPTLCSPAASTPAKAVPRSTTPISTPTPPHAPS